MIQRYNDDELATKRCMQEGSNVDGHAINGEISYD